MAYVVRDGGLSVKIPLSIFTLLTMRKILFGFAVLAAFSASAASVMTPEAGKAYTIQNATGLYMTAENNSLYLHDLDTTDDNQRFEFIAVDGTEGAYNIKMANGSYIGSDGKWTVAYKTDSTDTFAQFKIVASEADAEYIRLVCVGNNKGLGCDSDADGSNTFTDKDDSKATFRWTIAVAAEPTSVLTPSADKYYRIRHASGLYLTDARFASRVMPFEESNTQIYQFLPVEGQEGVYNIKRVNSGMFVGSDSKWSSTAISRNIAYSQHEIAVSDADEHYVTLRNLGRNGFMGTDNYNTDTKVYTDKNGKDAEKHIWFIEPAKKYDEAIPEGLDNLMGNGDFEDPAYAQEADPESNQMRLSELPGWTIQASDTWNGAQSIVATDSLNYLVLAGYQGDGWADVAVSQALQVIPGHEYALVFDYQHASAAGNNWGYRIADGSGILKEFSANTQDTEWQKATVRFVPASASLNIRFYLNSTKPAWWMNQDLYLNNVALYDLTPVDFYADEAEITDERANAYDGYRLVFAQEFSGEGTPDHDIWNFEEGFKRNNEDQYYNGDKNCYIQDGVLVIEGRNVLDQQIKNPKYDPFNTGWPSRIGKYLTWTSGSMQTKGSWNSGYTWNYGIYEVRAKVPQYVGSWPAIWSTGMQYEWPYGGEIDIMEYYGHCIHGNVCWGNGQRWAGAWNSATVHDNVLGAGWGDEFHTWRMVWDYDHMELWCDDILVNNIDLDTTQNAIPDADYDHGNGCNPFRDVRHMLWLNLALGGNNGGSLANTPRPLYYLVDYARVYQKVGTDGKATYSVDDVISEPNFKLKDGETGVAAVAVDNNAEVTGVYNLQGIRVADSVEALRGTNQVYIVVRGNQSEKVVL